MFQYFTGNCHNCSLIIAARVRVPGCTLGIVVGAIVESSNVDTTGLKLQVLHICKCVTAATTCTRHTQHAPIRTSISMLIMSLISGRLLKETGRAR